MGSLHANLNDYNWHFAEASLLAAMAQTADIPIVVLDGAVDPKPTQDLVDRTAK